MTSDHDPFLMRVMKIEPAPNKFAAPGVNLDDNWWRATLECGHSTEIRLGPRSEAEQITRIGCFKCRMAAKVGENRREAMEHHAKHRRN